MTNIKIDFGKFDVFDVEPPSIPDVLADRPVIVFGKYRGRPKGRIILQGTTGDQPYKKTIKVPSIKPQKKNSALRYLWARHRITLLSDYNRLRQNDERVKEVTNLGLTYNLLTAYTSFIAVDSQKRLYDGQTTTVKQPLPLPQGVSDYAVGKGSFASGPRACRKAPMPSYAGAINAPQALEMKEEVLESKDFDTEKQKLHHSSTKQEILVRLGEITVSNGLAKQDVQKLIEKQINFINLCYIKASKSTSGLTREAVVTLTLDAKGHVTRVQIDKSKMINSPIGNCITSHLEKLYFQQLKREGTIKIKILFIS